MCAVFLSRHKFFLLTYNITLTLRLSLICHPISFLITVTVTDLRAERLQKRSLSREERVKFVKKTTLSETSDFYASAEKEEIQCIFLVSKKIVYLPNVCTKSHHIYYSVTRERNVETFTDFHKIVYYNVDFKTLQTSLARVVSTVRSKLSRSRKLTLDQQICTAHTFR